MKTIRTLALAAFAVAAPCAYAGPSYTAPAMAPAPSYAPSMDLFGPGWSFGAHALYLTPDADIADDTWGGGINADYFVNPYVGFQGSAAWADPNTDEIWHNYTIDLVLRYPVEQFYFAPYVLGGGGAIVEDEWEILGRVGAGVEVRPTGTFGIFADWIYTFPGGGGGDDDLEDYQMIRMGVKFVF